MNEEYFALLLKERKIALENFLKTNNGKTLDEELSKLVKIKKISNEQKEIVLLIKADEFNEYVVNENGLSDIKYYLENFPELFTIHELLFAENGIGKYIFMINSDKEIEFEEILLYKGLLFSKHKKNLPDNRNVSIFIVFSNQSILVRESCILAKEAGFKIGCFVYDSKENMLNRPRYYRLHWYSIFPVINEDGDDDYSRSSGKFRRDLGRGFKSSWEANIARVMNYHQLLWQYEKMYYQTKDGTYIPDFKLIKDGIEYILEIKGFWDIRSVKKVSAILRGEGDLREEFILIDEDYYSLIQKKYQNLIPHWEQTQLRNNTFNIPVVGIFIDDRMQYIDKIKKDDTVLLVREKDNKFDSFAIKVMSEEGNHIGYVSKDWAAIFSYKMDRGFKYKCKFTKKDFKHKCLFIKLETIQNAENTGMLPFLN